MHVGWRRQYGNTGGWRGALAMISGENWQVAARVTRRHGGGTSHAEQAVEQASERPLARSRHPMDVSSPVLQKGNQA